jgi:hypothetical protein
MKRALPLVLLIGSWAAQARATPYMLDEYVAAQFRQVSVSPGDWGALGLVIDRNGTIYWQDPVFSPGSYGGPMQGDIGFVGYLEDVTGDGFASMRIGGPLTPNTYDGFRAFVANDDNSSWDYRLYASDGSTVVTGSTWTTLVPGTAASLQISFPAMTLKEVGFDIRGDYTLPNGPSEFDAFHVSVVPAPGALALVLLGLGVGWPLRRRVRRGASGENEHAA